MLAKTFRKSCADLGQRNAAGVGGNNRIWLANSFNLTPQVALNFQVLCHCFNDPITMGKLWNVVFQVAWGDQLGNFIGEHATGPSLGRSVNSLQRRSVAVGLIRYNNI